MVEISKADWKLFRERVSDWQEHYMEQLVKEYTVYHTAAFRLDIITSVLVTLQN